MEDFNADFDPTNYQYGADLVPEVGDIILYQEGYYEVDNITCKPVLCMGKNPDYPNNINPITKSRFRGIWIIKYLNNL